MQNNPHDDTQIPFAVRTRILRGLLSAELAAGIYGLRLFIACVAIATVMMGAVWMMGDGLSRSLSDSGTTLLGGDVAVTVVNVPLDDEVVDGLAGTGTLSRVAELRSSAVIGDARLPVEVKGVDEAYPLNGVVRLTSGQDLNAALQTRDGRPAVVVEPGLLRRFSAGVGDVIRLGDQEFVISDSLLIEPDRLSAGRFMVGPRVLMRLDVLTQTGLIQRGSIVDFRYRLDFAPETSLDAAIEAVAALRPETGWELETPRDAGDRVRRTVDRTTTFLGMAGIVALAIGLTGAWASARAWVSRRVRTIALYRLSGATPAVVGSLHAAIIAIASSLGVVLGLGLAAVGTAFLMQIVSAQLHLVWSPVSLVDPTLQVAWILVLGITGTSILALAGTGRLSPGAAMRSGEADLQPDNRQLGLGLALIGLAMAGATFSLPVRRWPGSRREGCVLLPLSSQVAGGCWHVWPCRDSRVALLALLCVRAC
ncbi:MAG: ABC transporter permease [Rhodospirillales bacterium]